MRAVIACQSWPRPDGTEAAPLEVTETVGRAWHAAARHVEVVTIALPDGGPRSADALDGPVTRVGGATARRVGDALVLAPARGSRWEPAALASALLGLATGGHRGPVVVPLGDVDPAGQAIDLWGGGLEAARAGLAGLDIVVAVGSDRPLLGFTGMSAAVRDGREHDAALALAAQEQEERWVAIARAADPVVARRTLVGPSRLSDQPGAGAAGGLAYALAALGGRLAPGADAMAGLAGLDREAADAAVIGAVVARLDAHGLDHGVTAAASRVAARGGVPCVAVTGHLAVGRRDLMAGGVAGAHQGEPGEQGLADQIRRVAHTWTPAR